MKMIEVLIKLANGEIKDGSILKIVDEYDELYRYEYYNPYRGFKNEVDDRIEDHFFLDKDFLNLEVELIPPKSKKYYLRLDGDDKLSYINLNKHASYEIAGKNEYVGYKTKFAQEEIDNDKFLKFIEQHGIKEEVDD
ncbi:hypothetical protein [Enterococcus cecorum]|uniref:hypothetical protein n=1 Tax=Enterococcus cecorum TaxID=44008 RepID=UPI0022D16FD5|nr:hypothetical protein CIRMBP1319_02354 [Enterococcus cecorum]